MSNLNRDLAILAEKEILQKVTLAMRSQAGPKRWFWELLQNALDTISEDDSRKINVVVFVGINENGKTIMRFEHDGTPFQETKDPNRFDDFKNLILPRSGKKTSDTKTVGKFGTGFLSTHALSTVIDVEGVFETKSGDKYGVSTTLDRTYFIDEDDQYDGHRIESIIKGLAKFDESRNSKQHIKDEKTRFTYYLNDEHAISKAKTGLLDLEQSLPVVMALNKKIGAIDVTNELDEKSYSFKAGELYDYKELKIQNCVKLEEDNPTTFSVAYLGTDELTICWPLEPYEGGVFALKNARKAYKESLEDKIPIVYSTFPMIGSGDLHFPLILHSSNFKPNEKRDGISITDEIFTTEDGNKIELDRANKDLIEKAVKLYQKFLEIIANDGENLAYAAMANHLPNKDWISPKWYKEHVIDKIREIIAHTPLIDVSNDKVERKSILDADGIIQVYFPSLNNGKGATQRKGLNNKLYIFSKQLFGDKIPLRKDLSNWYEVLWTDKDVIRIIEIEDVVKEVAASKSIKELSIKLKFDLPHAIRWLNHLYSFIDSLDEGSMDLYRNYAILPNQKGEFKAANELAIENSESKIEPELICVLRLIDPSVDYFDLLLHRSVKCKYVFGEKSLKDDVGPLINRNLIVKNDNGYYTFLNNPKAQLIISRLLSFKHHTSRDNSNREIVFSFSKDVFGSKQEKVIPYFRDFDLANTIAHQIRLINENIEKCTNVDGLATHLRKSKEATFTWLDDYLNFQAKGQYKNLIDWANVIPNQYEVFKARGEEQDRERMYKPYSVLNEKKNDILEPEIIRVLKKLPKADNDDWKQFLVHEQISLDILPSKTWDDLGSAIDNKVKEINTQIVSHDEEQKAAYLNPLLNLLGWFEVKENVPIAEKCFKSSFPLKDKLYLQLTFSPENVAVLKDKHTLTIAKALKDSNVSSEDVKKTISYLENIKNNYGENAVNEFLEKAKNFMSYKEEFKNRLETGQNIEQLLKQTLESEGIGVETIESKKGSFDLLISNKNNLTKSVKVEVKSYANGSSFDFRFANSQVMEANSDANNYFVCTLERPANDDVCDSEYLRNNLKVQPELVKLTSEIYPTVMQFDNIYKKSLSNEISLEIPCIEEPRVKVKHTALLNESGSYKALIELLKEKLL